MSSSSLSGTSRYHLAYFSPLPPAHSGVADYSAHLIPALAQLADLTLFVEDPTVLDPEWQAFGAIRPFTDYPATRFQYDIAIHQLGNSAIHHTQYDVFRRYPGLAVLHDYGLHHFMADRSIWNGRTAHYTQEYAYNLGPTGSCLAWQVQAGQIDAPLYQHSLNKRILDSSLGIIVHSGYVKQKILSQHPAPSVQQISQIMPLASG